jgi:LysM repeat protein
MKSKIFSLLLALSLVLGLSGQVAQAQCAGTVHTVRTGENLYRISLAYGLTWDVVAAFNGISNPNQVQVSQDLCIPTGGTFGTGGPLTQGTTTTTTTTAGGTPSGTFPDANTSTAIIGGPVPINSGTFILERAANSVSITVPAGTLDVQSGYSTTATVILDATNNNLGISTGGMIPNAQARIYVSPVLGDISGGYAGVLLADRDGVINGFVEIPFISSNIRQYVMIRAYDGRMTWGYFDLGQRFP